MKLLQVVDALNYLGTTRFAAIGWWVDHLQNGDDLVAAASLLRWTHGTHRTIDAMFSCGSTMRSINAASAS